LGKLNDNNCSAHSAFDFVEFGQCLRKAYDDCKVVEILTKFTNFTDTVKPLLNTANTTVGANHFSDFRYILNKVIDKYCPAFFLS
jgi:hypothetical protein